MLPVAVQVPPVDGVVFPPRLSATDLLNPAKARRRPIEQRTKPIKTRGLKKADREVEFVFIRTIFFVDYLVTWECGPKCSEQQGEAGKFRRYRGQNVSS